MGDPRSILVVEDEPDIRGLLVHHLAREGFAVRAVADGASALIEAAAEPPQLVILDLMLPGMSGTEVCRTLRATPALRSVPILILSARSDEVDRVVGFEVGADDYVTKPFSGRELMLRVRALLRRAAQVTPPSERLGFPGLEIDLDQHRVWVEGEEVTFTPIELRLLVALLRRQGRVLQRGQLLRDVWDASPDLDTRTVDTHVKRLRAKLGRLGSCVVTLRGVGFRFEPPA